MSVIWKVELTYQKTIAFAPVSEIEDQTTQGWTQQMVLFTHYKYEVDCTYRSGPTGISSWREKIHSNYIINNYVTVTMELSRLSLLLNKMVGQAATAWLKASQAWSARTQSHSFVLLLYKEE